MRELPEHPLLESIGVSDTELGRLTLASLDHLQEAISIFDQGLRLMVWNRRFLELLDFPPELIRIGLPFDELMRFNARRGEYGEGDPEALVAERVRLARRFESHCFERIRPDGTVLEVRGQPISGGGFITIYQDITARMIETIRKDYRAYLTVRMYTGMRTGDPYPPGSGEDGAGQGRYVRQAVTVCRWRWR